jgi:alpha-methylacyl-CoA racemase
MGVLSGVRVLELAGIGPGQFCGMMLADMGADVALVAREAGGQADAAPDLLNRNKRAISLDLKSAAGVETALRLVERADMLIEPFRPGVAERLGLGPDVCLKRNPKLVYGRMTGWGQSGPLAGAAGHDINYIAVTGVLDSIGTPEMPLPPINLVGDYGGGALYLLGGLLAAYSHVLKGGDGQAIDAAMCDGTASLMTGTYAYLQQGRWKAERGANFLDGSAPDYAVYRCADDRFIAISPMEDRFFRNLVEALASEAEDLRNWADWDRDQLRARLARIFCRRTRDEWIARLEGVDCCVTPVLSIEEAPSHPHLAGRETYITVDQVLQPAPAPRFSDTPSSPPAPLSRTDADTLLRAWSPRDRSSEAHPGSGD